LSGQKGQSDSSSPSNKTQIQAQRAHLISFIPKNCQIFLDDNKTFPQVKYAIQIEKVPISTFVALPHCLARSVSSDVTLDL
jgi:hypothetical protein